MKSALKSRSYFVKAEHSTMGICKQGARFKQIAGPGILTPCQMEVWAPQLHG